MLKKMQKKQEGFTLVELIVVIAILGVLATLLVPNIMGNVKESKSATIISNARTVASEVTVYNAKLVTTGATPAATLDAAMTACGAGKDLSSSDRTKVQAVLKYDTTTGEATINPTVTP